MEGLRRIVERTRTPICTGENACGLRGATQMVAQARPAWLMLDLERWGGITG